MKKCLILLGVFITGQLLAQTYLDMGLLFSRTGTPGTARSVGAGNAFGSVGADLSSTGINPAGLGLYRSFDVSITPGLSIARNEAQFNGSFKNQGNTKVLLNQAGIVFTKLFKKNKSSQFTFNPTGINSISFAINYQRQSAFSRSQTFEGYNPNNSAMDVYAYVLNSTNQPLTTDNYPIEMLLAYDANMIGYDTTTGNFSSNISQKVQQSGQIIKRGSVDQIDLSLGGNVNDKFYFGMGLGIPILTYFDNSYFDEAPVNDTGTYWNGYTFQTNLRSTGVGINAKFGFIYRPAAWMRFGVAYHIPTFYSITETYSAALAVDYDTSYYNYGADAQPLRHKFRSPMKGVVSTSFYIKEHGFFSIDYEFLNYGSMRYNFGKNYQEFSDEVNANAKKVYKFGHNVRFGFEGAYKTLRVRTGYTYSSSPLKKDYITKGFTEDKHSASIGLGYRGKRFYADFAYMFGFTKDATYPYADYEVKNTLTSHTMLLTIGWKINRDETAKKGRNTPPARDDRSF